MRLRFLNFFFISVVQEYQNKIWMVQTRKQNNTKTSGKPLRISSLFTAPCFKQIIQQFRQLKQRILWGSWKRDWQRFSPRWLLHTFPSRRGRPGLGDRRGRAGGRSQQDGVSQYNDNLNKTVYRYMIYDDKLIYERVAVGRKYPCCRLPRICLLWELLQSLFHVQMGSNLNLGQSLYVHPLWLWVDDNLLAWSGAIHLYKKAIILAVNTAIYMVKVVLAGF